MSDPFVKFAGRSRARSHHNDGEALVPPPLIADAVRPPGERAKRASRRRRDRSRQTEPNEKASRRLSESMLARTVREIADALMSTG